MIKSYTEFINEHEDYIIPITDIEESRSIDADEVIKILGTKEIVFIDEHDDLFIIFKKLSRENKKRWWSKYRGSLYSVYEKDDDKFIHLIDTGDNTYFYTTKTFTKKLVEKYRGKITGKKFGLS